MSVSGGRQPRYVIISAVRNEAKHIEETIRSMRAQTARPAQWILVDDGSSDGTGEIVDHWASMEPWIVAIHRRDGSPARCGTPEAHQARGKRARRAKEIEAFYEGFRRISVPDWEYIGKLDGDLGFDAEYFEKCFVEFARDSRLGIGGGVICHQATDGELRTETTPEFHVRGATKIYRRACWDDIGGVLPGAGWDTIDEVKANMLGWKTRSFHDLEVIHFRPTGAAAGAWHNAVKNGLWNYTCGYHPLFMLVKCLKRLWRKPLLIDSTGLAYGFIQAYVTGSPQIEDKRVIRYLREQQLRRLSFRPTIWK